MKAIRSSRDWPLVASLVSAPKRNRAPDFWCSDTLELALLLVSDDEWNEQCSVAGQSGDPEFDALMQKYMREMK